MEINDPYLIARKRLHQLERQLGRNNNLEPDAIVRASYEADAIVPTTTAGAFVKLKDVHRFLALPGNVEEPWEWLAKHYVAKAIRELKRMHPSAALYLRAALALVPPRDENPLAVALRTACEPLLKPAEAMAA